MGPLAILSMVTSFFGSALGRYIGIGLIAVAVYAAGEVRGRRVATDACKAAAFKAKEAAKTQDQVAQENVNVDNDATVDMLQKQKEKADGTIASLQLQLNARPLSAPCLYGPNGRPASGGVRAPNASGGAGDTNHPRAPLVLAPRGGPAGN